MMLERLNILVLVVVVVILAITNFQQSRRLIRADQQFWEVQAAFDKLYKDCSQ